MPVPCVGVGTHRIALHCMPPAKLMIDGHGVCSLVHAHAGLKVCQGARRHCLGAEGVLRVSLGCFVFFFVMFLSTVKARKVHDCRNSWHSDWWPAKIVLWLALTAVAFLAPSPLVQLYGQY